MTNPSCASPPRVRGWKRCGRRGLLRGALLVLACPVLGLGLAGAEPAGGIQQINLVHFSHTDVGFTDSPSVCRELYRRYLDVALDAARDTQGRPEGERFRWTAESALAVDDWWRAASESRRELFLEAVRSGQLELTASACNNTPFLNAAQWRTFLHWLPEPLWQAARPTVAVQNDVNGTPRALAMGLLDRGVRHLFTGINEDSGGVPFPRPSAFWWKMPDGRRMFVWLNIGYGSGFDFFEPREWRRGPVPRAADTVFRPPRAGEILRTDEASLRAANAICRARLKALEDGGYRHPVLTLSITSQWRFDNDPPFPALAEFVTAWNRLGLQPRLRLATAGVAMQQMEEVLGPTAPEHEGEWTDWWANGTASGPREVAASRVAKRHLAAVQSPVWGPLEPRGLAAVDAMYRDLCLFDEHTWGSSLSVAKPYSLDTQAQFTEKAALAFRPMARAEWLLAQRVRTRLAGEGAGLFLANPASAPFTGWVRFIASGLREDYRSLEDPQSGARLKLEFEPGIEPWGRPRSPQDLSAEDVSATFPDAAPDKVARFWANGLGAQSIRRLKLSRDHMPEAAVVAGGGVELKTDAAGWPERVRWKGMTEPLFLPGLGEFSAVKVNAFAPRHALADIRARQGAARESMRRDLLETIVAVPGTVSRQETPYSLVFTQGLRHPRLQWGTRVLELWKGEPRARLTLRLNRISSAAPEIFYLAFPLPTGDALPRLSNGGQSFVPFSDQLPGTCRDYFAIDGWAEYVTPQGRWLWVSRDAPLVSLGASPTLANLGDPPADRHVLLAMLFNNFWYTNFVADEQGILEFQFDLAWRADEGLGAVALAEAMELEPVVLINPEHPEDPRVMEHLYRP